MLWLLLMKRRRRSKRRRKRKTTGGDSNFPVIGMRWVWTKHLTPADSLNPDHNFMGDMTSSHLHFIDM